MKSAEKLPTLSEFRKIQQFKGLKPRQLRFLSALLRCNLIITKAGQIAKCDWRNHYWWLANEKYKQAYEFTREMLGDMLEYTMLDHAIAGKDTPIIYKGAITGNYKEIISSERITLLKGFKPQYRDSFNPAGAAAPITLSIISPIQQPAEIDVTNQGNSSDSPKKINPPD